MANHCYNYVSFSGKKEMLIELKEGIKEAEAATNDKYFYQFCDRVVKADPSVKKDYLFYGTKWFEYEIDHHGDTMCMQGDSAWGPPQRFVEAMCKQYGLCAILEYEEPGNDFAGIIKYDSTGEIEHEEFTYHELQYNTDFYYWKEEILDMYDDSEDDSEIKEHLKVECTYASDKHKKEVLDAFNNSKKE